VDVPAAPIAGSRGTGQGGSALQGATWSAVVVVLRRRVTGGNKRALVAFFTPALRWCDTQWRSVS
jgi:hypothetical protein